VTVDSRLSVTTRTSASDSDPPGPVVGPRQTRCSLGPSRRPGQVPASPAARGGPTPGHRRRAGRPVLRQLASGKGARITLTTSRRGRRGRRRAALAVGPAAGGAAAGR
jgi:hypothetical protein